MVNSMGRQGREDDLVRRVPPSWFSTSCFMFTWWEAAASSVLHQCCMHAGCKECGPPFRFQQPAVRVKKVGSKVSRGGREVVGIRLCVLTTKSPTRNTV